MVSRYKTITDLIFNDPVQGKEFLIPAGESCMAFTSIQEACDHGYLDKKNEQEMWAARTNIQRGYVLVVLKGKLRGVASAVIEHE